jgi:transcriptional regulator with XRE-family HTH domain
VNGAELIRAARRRRGLTQAELASRAGTSQPVISAYENGRRSPSMATLRRLISASGERLELRLAERAPAIPPPADLVEHGQRLVDVLLLADAVPVSRRRSRELDGPRIASTR